MARFSPTRSHRCENQTRSKVNHLLRVVQLFSVKSFQRFLQLSLSSL